MAGSAHSKAPRNGAPVKLGRSPITGQIVWKPVSKRGGAAGAAKVRKAVQEVVAGRNH